MCSFLLETQFFPYGKKPAACVIYICLAIASGGKGACHFVSNLFGVFIFSHRVGIARVLSSSVPLDWGECGEFIFGPWYSFCWGVLKIDINKSFS